MNRAQAQAGVTEADFELAARESLSLLMQIAVASARNPIDAEDIVQQIGQIGQDSVEWPAIEEMGNRTASCRAGCRSRIVP